MPVAFRAAADADGGDFQFGGNLPRQRRRNQFQHNHRGAGVLHGQGVVDNPLGVFLVAPLHFKSAVGAGGLRHQPHVGANRDASFGDKADGGREQLAALYFHHRGAGGHQFGGVGEGKIGAALKGAERHVAQHKGVRRAGDNIGDMSANVGEGDCHGVAASLQDHSEGVADQHHIHSAGGQHGGECGVVGGQRGDFFAVLFHTGKTLGHFCGGGWGGGWGIAKVHSNAERGGMCNSADCGGQAMWNAERIIFTSSSASGSFGSSVFRKAAVRLWRNR